MSFNIIEDLTVPSTKPLTSDDLVLAAIFGGSVSVAKYDTSKVYARDEKITYTTADGRTVILSAKTSNITGAFNLDNWWEFNFFGGNGGKAMNDPSLINRLDNIIIDSIMNL